MSLDSIAAWKKDTVTLNAAIGGISVERGYRCIDCGHCTPVWGSMTDHFLKWHEGKDVKEWTEDDIEMQAAFGGKLKR